MKTWLFVLAFTLVAGAAVAQNATPNSRFYWDPQPNTMMTVAQAEAHGWEVMIDTTPAQRLPSATCTSTGTPALLTCSALIVAITPGPHTAMVRAVNLTVPGSPINGIWGSPLSFTMLAIPAAPTNLRIGPPVVPPAEEADPVPYGDPNCEEEAQK